MSAQQRTAQPPPPPPPPSASASQITEAQPGMYNQQRRPLGNIPSTGSNVRPSVPPRDGPPTGASVPVPKSPARTPLNTPAPSSTASVPQKPQFFAHNPSLRSNSLLISLYNAFNVYSIICVTF